MNGVIKRIVPILIGIACFGLVWKWTRAPKHERDGVTITLTVTSSMSDVYELFYDTIGQGFGQEWSARAYVKAALRPQEVEFHLPSIRTLRGLRLDPGDRAATLSLSSLSIAGPYRRIILDERDILEHFTLMHELDSVRLSQEEHAVIGECTGTDPYLATERSLEDLTRSTLSRSRPALGPLILAALVGLIAAMLFTWIISWCSLSLGGWRPWSGMRFAGAVVVLVSSALIYALVHGLLQQIHFKDHDVSLLVAGGFPKADEVQLYHAQEEGRFAQERSISKNVMGHNDTQLIRFALPLEPTVRYLRFDPGMRQDNLWLDSISISVDEQIITWRGPELLALIEPNEQIADLRIDDGRLEMRATGNDPNFNFVPDIPAVIDGLYKASGNGPIPALIAALATLFFLLGTGGRLASADLGARAGPVNIFLIVAFGAVICAPLLTRIAALEPELANTEKRLLAENPPYSLARALVYPVEFTRYFEENFGLRKLYFRWHSLFLSKVLRTSPLPEKVIFGKGDWMFYMQQNIITKYEGRCDLTADQLRTVADRLELRRQWLERQGIDYVLMFPPEKSVVYPDKLPWRIEQFHESSCLDLLKQEITERTRLKLVDIRDELRDARGFSDVYYTSDTHWNPVGAWFGYCGLLNAIRSTDSTITPAVPFDRFRIESEVNPHGDLAELMGLTDVFPRTTPHMTPLDQRFARDTTISPSVARFTRYSPIIKYVPGSKAPRLLMFRDSFAVYMIPYLSEHFSRSSYVWTPIFFHEVVEEEKPDIIVHEVMELFLSDLLKDDRELPSEASAMP